MKSIVKKSKEANKQTNKTSSFSLLLFSFSFVLVVVRLNPECKGPRETERRMFLEQVQKICLLSHNPDSDILEIFPLSVKKVLIQEVTSFLLNSDDHSTLTSQAHVKWVMEVVGAGFALPIDEVDLIR